MAATAVSLVIWYSWVCLPCNYPDTPGAKVPGSESSWNFRSRQRKFHTMVLSLPGAKVLRSESSCYLFWQITRKFRKNDYTVKHCKYLLYLDIIEQLITVSFVAVFIMLTLNACRAIVNAREYGSFLTKYLKILWIVRKNSFTIIKRNLLLLLSSNIAKSSKVPSRYNNDVESNCRNKLV